jgi:hypothetical protein
MRSEPLLTMEPPAPVQSMAELYAIALDQATTAARRYDTLATTRGGPSADPPGEVRSVFEILMQRERDRAQSMIAACFALLEKRPDPADLRWTPTELVPAEELSEIGNSSLSTPYGAWALAVRHRERGFIFWTYIAALAETIAVRTAAEDIARKALLDCNWLRRERRLAWRNERHPSTDRPSESQTDGISSAALLESLLLKDIVAWSQDLPHREREHLLALGGQIAPAEPSIAVVPEPDATDRIERRVLRRAEQLSQIYLDEADNAEDHDRMQLAQTLATRSIARLADLRAIASTRRDMA